MFNSDLRRRNGGDEISPIIEGVRYNFFKSLYQIMCVILFHVK